MEPLLHCKGKEPFPEHGEELFVLEKIYRRYQTHEKAYQTAYNRICCSQYTTERKPSQKAILEPFEEPILINPCEIRKVIGEESVYGINRSVKVVFYQQIGVNQTAPGQCPGDKDDESIDKGSKTEGGAQVGDKD